MPIYIVLIIYSSMLMPIISRQQVMLTAEDAADADAGAYSSSNTRELHTSEHTIVPWAEILQSYPVQSYQN